MTQNINSIANLLVNSGLSEAEAFEMAEHDFNVFPTYAELAESDAEYEAFVRDLYDEEDYDWGDYGDYYEPIEQPAPVYLDKVLDELEGNTNVIIFLNSARIVYGGFGVDPIMTQDCIGNHTASVWVEALNLMHLHHSLDGQFDDTLYKVLAVVTAEDGTVKVYLDATRENNSTVEGLDYSGNLCASRW